MELTLRPIAWLNRGPVLKRDHPFHFAVVGLPEGQEAWVCEFSHRWKTLTYVNGKQGEWEGSFGTKEDALAVIHVRCGNLERGTDVRDE
jgi:hypothetical protein